MGNHVVIFPAEKEAEANAYRDAANAWFAANFPSDPQELYCYIRQDAFGSWVVPYIGPPAEYPYGTPMLEPAELVPLRADGVISDKWFPPGWDD